jgi:sugar lactone lactonase YvrE
MPAALAVESRRLSQTPGRGSRIAVVRVNPGTVVALRAPAPTCYLSCPVSNAVHLARDGTVLLVAQTHMHAIGTVPRGMNCASQRAVVFERSKLRCRLLSDEWYACSGPVFRPGPIHV